METTLELTEEAFIRTWMTGNRKEFAKILDAKFKESRLTKVQLAEMGISSVQYNSYIRMDKRPSEKMMDKLIDILFNNCRNKNNSNKDMVEYMREMTGYEYDYEYRLDFGVTKEQLTAAKYKAYDDELICSDEFMQKVNEDWPDTLIIRNMIAEKHVDIKNMISAITEEFPETFPGARNNIIGIFTSRLSQYLDETCRMPKKLYDFIIDYISASPKTRLDLMPGYTDIRKEIVSSIWLHDEDKAKKLTKKLIDSAYTGEKPAGIYKTDITGGVLKSKRRSSTLHTIMRFDELCERIYEDTQRYIQNCILIIRKKESTIRIMQNLANDKKYDDVYQTLHDITENAPAKLYTICRQCSNTENTINGDLEKLRTLRQNPAGTSSQYDVSRIINKIASYMQTYVDTHEQAYFAYNRKETIA